MVCVGQASASLLRMLMGVREEENPFEMHKLMMSEQLTRLGYSKEHALRALEKSNYVLSSARKWLDENASWLNEQKEIMEALVQDEMKSKAPLQEVEEKDEKTVEVIFFFFVCVCVLLFETILIAYASFKPLVPFHSELKTLI